MICMRSSLAFNRPDRYVFSNQIHLIPETHSITYSFQRIVLSKSVAIANKTIFSRSALIVLQQFGNALVFDTFKSSLFKMAFCYFHDKCNQTKYFMGKHFVYGLYATNARNLKIKADPHC